MFKKWIILFTIYCFCQNAVLAQIKPLSSSEIQSGLQKLNTLGTVLYFAAHPDDENTRLIAWLAQEKNYRTGYLSLTRGDGGQNLIGTEQGIDLGLIRTQELLAARAIDKGEQFFSSAYDFGFSKTHEETFTFWDKETALREAVWIIRQFQPDIIINRFAPDKRGGHGHHQASAILSEEAFKAAADPTLFPEQLQYVKPWQAKRLLWNTANFGGMNNTSEEQLKIDIGSYNPLIGHSYGEIAAQSRSQHKSQGFGAASSRGSSIEYFDLVAGAKAEKELFDGIETSWKRIPNSEKIQQVVNKLNLEFEAKNPQKSIPDLFLLKGLINNIADQYWKTQKTKEIDQLIIACAGLWVEATTAKPQYPTDYDFEINLEAVVQNPGVNIELQQVNNSPVNSKLIQNKTWKSQQKSTWPAITQPYWLRSPHSLGKFEVAQQDLGNPENMDKPKATFVFKINGQELILSTDIQYKMVDPVHGERYQDITIVPALTIALPMDNFISMNGRSQKVAINFTRNNTQIKNYRIKVSPADGWDISPEAIDLQFDQTNTLSKEIEIKPAKATTKDAKLSFEWEGKKLHSTKTIAYNHIPSITWFPTAEAELMNLQIENPIKKVAYIAGAGDLVAQSLRQIGIETTFLNEDEITAESLKHFDAVILGIRYFNISNKAENTSKILLQYVNEGGVVLVQYNVNTKLQAEQIGPFPFEISRARVTEENAIINVDKNDIAFQYPNQITEKDFDNWIQERGLYFADHIDPKYRTPMQMNDKEEPSNNGALLIADYGKGKFVYTSLAFFRQLPAGVPGAYRLFVNLLTKEK